jgi:hypothetical protein
MRRLAFGASVIGLAIGTVIALSTFVADEPVFPLWLDWVLFAGVFPVHFRGVLRLRGGNGRSFFRRLRADVGRTRYRLFQGYFVVLWIFAVTAIFQLRHGGPSLRDGRYFLDNHGSLTEVSKTTYDGARLALQRVFAAVPAAFYSFGVVVNGARHG